MLKKLLSIVYVCSPSVTVKPTSSVSFSSAAFSASFAAAMPMPLTSTPPTVMPAWNVPELIMLCRCSSSLSAFILSAISTPPSTSAAARSDTSTIVSVLRELFCGSMPALFSIFPLPL